MKHLWDEINKNKSAELNEFFLKINDLWSRVWASINVFINIVEKKCGRSYC